MSTTTKVGPDRNQQSETQAVAPPWWQGPKHQCHPQLPPRAGVSRKPELRPCPGTPLCDVDVHTRPNACPSLCTFSCFDSPHFRTKRQALLPASFLFYSFHLHPSVEPIACSLLGCSQLSPYCFWMSSFISRAICLPKMRWKPLKHYVWERTDTAPKALCARILGTCECSTKSCLSKGQLCRFNYVKD